MKLSILTPEKKIIHEIVWVEANTPSGNFVIQPGHIATLLILLAQQPVTYCLKNGKQEIIYPTSDSIMHVHPDEITILCSE